MSGILARIFATKAEEVAEAKRRRPLPDLQAAVGDVEPPRAFHAAIAGAAAPVALIAEVKKASPAKGLVRADFDPVEIALAYRRAGAHALSVLTDVHYFQGAPEYLSQCRDASGLPALRKDFVYDPYQVWESRALGADAILLIVAGLEVSQMADLQALAWSLGMAVLVEAHTEADLDAALAIEAKLIGVNNRDLGTFETRLEVSEALIPRIGGAALAVSESAIEGPEDVRRVAAAGARAVLVGTAFCREPDVAAAVRRIMAWPSS